MKDFLEICGVIVACIVGLFLFITLLYWIVKTFWLLLIGTVVVSIGWELGKKLVKWYKDQ